jgi:serine/threonine protein kinase/ligand-binding sensor domain-containing protein
VTLPRSAHAGARFAERLFTTSDGLSQSGVTAIELDRDGYLWIGTQDGLNRYDGARFKQYFVEDGLPSNFVDALLIDAKGRVWVGTHHGIAVQDAGAWRAIALPADVVASSVTSLALAFGAVYAAVGPHVVRIDPDTRAATLVPYDEARGDASSLAVAKDGALLIGTRRGLLRLRAGGALEPVVASGAKLESIAIHDMRVDARGDVWIAAEDAGVYVLRGDALAPFGDAEGLHTRHINRITAADPGVDAILLSTYDDGLYRVSGGVAERVAAPKHRVSTAAVDGERTIWAADFSRGGLVRLEPAKFETITERDGLPTNEVYGLLHARDGGAWIATVQGLVHATGGSYATAHLAPEIDTVEFTGVAEAPDGTICAGTLKRGVVCMRKGNVTSLTKKEGLGGDTVDDLAFDAKGRLWLATSGGASIVENGAVVRTLGTADGLLDALLYSIYVDRKGDVWVGYSNRSGVSRWDGALFEHFGEAQGMPHGGVTSIFEDAGGALWITSDGGLAKKTGDRFRAFSKKDGLPSDEVYVALEDAHGALWLNTDQGIAKFVGDKVVETYTIDDGLAANEGQSRGGAKDARGRLWFSSTGGVTIIDPDHVPTNAIAPRVLIESIDVGGRATLPAAMPAMLSHADNNVRFEFTATSFREPRAMRFAYRLDGFDKSWTQMAPPVLVRAAAYTNLPPGDYTFEVRATNDDGVWCKEPAVVRFRIAAPWWRTPWAFAIAAASLVGLGYAATMLRLRGLRHRAVVLEAKVQERTRELAEKNLLLDAQLEHVKTLNEELVESQKRADRIFSAYAEALPGTILDGKYRLDERVGDGGFGVVFRATHLDLKRTLAVKVFKPQPGNDSAEAAERFRREAISACRVQHPNAVAVYDSGISSDGIAYLVMELLSGESLSDRLKREDRLPLRTCAWIIRGLCAALDAAHAQGIVHRDIKPANVFLHKLPDAEIVKVVDFGVARLLDPSALSRQVELTATDAIIGTPSYIAPERLAGETYDGRSDVYSVGVIAYEMLSGRLPYELDADAGLVAKIMKQLNDDPTPLGKYVAGLPPDVEALVMRAIAKLASQRPSARELADAFDALLRDLPDEVLDTVPAARPGSIRPPRTSESTVASAPMSRRDA